MANVQNPHKRFQFSIQVFGMNPFLAQKVTLPDRTIDKVEHGEGNHVIKTAGMVKFGDLIIEKISPATVPDRLMWDYIFSVQNEFTGGGLIPEVYKRAIQVQKYATDGITVVKSWEYIGAWPFKINGIELDRLSSENTIETIEFSIDREGLI